MSGGCRLMTVRFGSEGLLKSPGGIPIVLKRGEGGNSGGADCLRVRNMHRGDHSSETPVSGHLDRTRYIGNMRLLCLRVGVIRGPVVQTASRKRRVRISPIWLNGLLESPSSDGDGDGANVSFL